MNDTIKPLEVTDVVKYKDGHYRIRSLFKTTCNLCGVFNNKIIHKKVPLNEVVEDRENWYNAWTQSETYMSM